MSKDVAPNIATLVMGVKDKVAGSPGTMHRDNEVIPELATPATVVEEANRYLGFLEKSIKIKEHQQQDTFDDEWNVSLLKKAKNTANAIRMFGPAAPVKQGARLMAAEYLTNVMVGKDIIGNNLPSEAEDHNRRVSETRLHIAACLGHKQSVVELTRRKSNSINQ